MRSLFLFLLCNIAAVNAAVINLYVKFSNESLDPAFFVAGEDRIFGVNWYSCLQEIATDACPGGQSSFQPEYYIRTTDLVDTDTYLMELDTGNEYTGSIVIELYAPISMFTDENANPKVMFTSSVTDCADEPADYEMGLEICGNQGQPWTVQVNDVSQHINLTIFPAFGLSETGNSSILLPDFYSPQLNNSRDIPVYQPPSVLQNKVTRPLNIMIVLDANLNVISNFASRTGFEAAQVMGETPESIMIGINTLDWFYDLDYSQRTYELTYAVSMDFPTESCIDGSYSPTGGSDLLLDWLDADVIPAVLEKLNMTRGEVGITGGSLGGLTSCYAAASRPTVFSRAVCCSATNCYNYGNGGLSTVIKNSYASSGVSAKTVIQFQGTENYDGDFVYDGDENQSGLFIQDDKAWQSIGMVPLSVETTFYKASSKNHITYPYVTLDAPEDHVIMSLLLPGGQHAPSTWQQEFAAALPNLYRADPFDVNRIAKSESLKYMSVDSTTDDVDKKGDDDDEDDKGRGRLAVALIAIVVILSVALLSACAYISTLRKKISSETNKLLFSSGVEGSTL